MGSFGATNQEQPPEAIVNGIVDFDIVIQGLKQDHKNQSNTLQTKFGATQQRLSAVPNIFQQVTTATTTTQTGGTTFPQCQAPTFSRLKNQPKNKIGDQEGNQGENKSAGPTTTQ